MSEKFIPEHIDPFRYADQCLSLSGLVKYTDMQRLQSSLLSSEGVAQVELQFRTDEQGLTCIKGQVQAELTIQCQRCIQPFKYEIICDFSLAVVNTLEEASVLPEQYDPVVVKDKHIALRELIEDEIILNMPIIARHKEEDCSVALPLRETSAQEEVKINPFDVLASLKSQEQV